MELFILTCSQLNHNFICCLYIPYQLFLSDKEVNLEFLSQFFLKNVFFGYFSTHLGHCDFPFQLHCVKHFSDRFLQDIEILLELFECYTGLWLLVFRLYFAFLTCFFVLIFGLIFAFLVIFCLRLSSGGLLMRLFGLIELTEFLHFSTELMNKLEYTFLTVPL